MNPLVKLVLILLTVLLLFAGVLVFGLEREDAGKPQLTGLLDGLDSTFSIEQPLTASDVLASCFDGRVFRARAGAPCSVTIRASDTHIRKMNLRLVAGSEGVVDLNPRGDSGVKINAPIHAKNPPSTMQFQILEGGAQLSFTCKTPPPGGMQPCQFLLSP